VHYQLNFFFVVRRLSSLWDGLLVSLELTAAAIAIGLVFGIVVVLARMSRSVVLRHPAGAFIEFFRCTPAMVQIIWFYYCTPILLPVDISAFVTVLLALGLNLAAFNAEAYRAAIQAIPKAHLDAAVALGLSRLQRVRYILLPQAVRIAAPVLVTNAIGIFQQSALVSLVAVADLMYKGRMLAVETYRPIETLSTVAFIYLAVATLAAYGAKWLENRTMVDVG